jgi:hypothetical protein
LVNIHPLCIYSHNLHAGPLVTLVNLIPNLENEVVQRAGE